MRFLRRWLRVERPAGVAINPRRTLDLDEPSGSVYERAVEGVQNVLGGTVTSADSQSGAIEASFGLVHSERLRVQIADEDGKTRVTIEARRGAIAEQPRSSTYVDALARYLERR